MSISAAAVKELRDKTGAGMMDCRRALEEAGGDLDEAVKILRKKGLSAAAKRSGRVAKEGLVVITLSADDRRAGIVELNSETDFVARNERFAAFAKTLSEQAMEEQSADAAAMAGRPFAGEPSMTVTQAIANEIATIGENIVLTRAASLTATDGMRLGAYVHMGGKIGVVVEVSEGASDETLRDVAMHVAAAEPRFVHRGEVPESVLKEERDIAKAQAEAMGKPAAVAEKIAEGKLGKFFEQACLVDQEWVKDPTKKVSEMLAANGSVQVRRFIRFRLGEASAVVVQE